MATEHFQAVRDCLSIFSMSSKSPLKGFEVLKKIIHLDFISVASSSDFGSEINEK